MISLGIALEPRISPSVMAWFSFWFWLRQTQMSGDLRPRLCPNPRARRPHLVESLTESLLLCPECLNFV